MTTLTPTAPPAATVPDAPAPGLADAVRAEWTKLRTARAPRRNLVLGTVLGVAMSALLSLAIASSFDDWSASDRADFDPVLYPLSGSVLMVIFFVTASVGVVASEYSSGMIGLSLTAVPRRGRLLLAKTIVVTAAVSVASAIACVGMFAVSQAIFSAGDVPSVGLTDGTLLKTFALLVVTGPVFPVLSVAVAFLLRTAAASVTTILALIFLPNIVGGLLPDWWQRNVLSLLPGNASDSLAIGHLGDSIMYLAPAPATLVVVAWIVGSLLVAHRVLARRDT